MMMKEPKYIVCAIYIVLPVCQGHSACDLPRNAYINAGIHTPLFVA
jgi:hypothetical protein